MDGYKRWLHFQKTAITPAFKDLRNSQIFCSVQKLKWCQTDAHAELSGDYSSYVFFHWQSKMSCIELESDQEMKLYIGYHFETTEVEARAILALRKYFNVLWDGDKRKCIILCSKDRSLWAVIRRWFVIRCISLYWHGLTSHLYASGCVGRKRDRCAFEEECVSLISV